MLAGMPVRPDPARTAMGRLRAHIQFAKAMFRPKNIGAKAQILGALATAIGLMLRIFGPAPVPGFPINPQQYADVILTMGLCMLVIGTVLHILSRT